MIAAARRDCGHEILEGLRPSGDGARAGLKALTDRADQRLGVHRLSKHARNVEVIEVHRAARDDDDRNMLRMRVRRDLLIHEEAADGGQREVEHDEMRRIVLNALEGSGAVRRFFDGESRDCERGPKHPSQIAVILNDQDRPSTSLLHAGIVTVFITTGT